MWLLLAWKLDWQNIFSGAAVALITAVIFGNIGFEKDGRTSFSFIRAYRFIRHIIFILRLWVEGALAQIISALLGANINGNKTFNGTFWLQIELKKTSSKYFLTHALYYAPNVVVVDFEGDKVLIKWSGMDPDIPEKTEKLVRRLEKKLAGIFE